MQFVELNKKEQEALKKLNDKQAAIQSYVQMVQANAEQKMAECQQEGREVWGKIAEAHDLDLSTHAYTLSQDGTKLVLTQVRYGGQ